MATDFASGSPVSHIIALLPTPALRAQLESAVGSHAEIAPVTRIADALRALESGGNVSGIITETQEDSQAPTLPFVLDVKRRHPDVPVIVYATINAATLRYAVDMARHGVDQLVLHRYDDAPVRFLELLRRTGVVRDATDRPQIDRRIVLVGSAISQRLIQRLARQPDGMYSLGPRQFEELVAELLSKQGFDVATTASTRDGGKDIIVRCSTALGDQVYYVECKRYAPDRPVGVSLVRELYGVVQSERVTGGILATTSYFSSDAVTFQSRVPFQLSLRDKSDITHWLERAAAGSLASKSAR